MRALWLEDTKLSLRDDLPVPKPPPGEALIRVRLAGVCGTDLELAKGYYPFRGIPGHEFVGEVVEASGAPSWDGQRVVGEINATCGQCRECQAGRRTHCLSRTVLGIVGRDGAFADFLILPLESLHPVPDSVGDAAAVFCEPLAAALQVLELASVKPTTTVLVIGAGRLGQLIARTLALTGCRLSVITRHQSQQTRLDRLGIDCLGEDEALFREYDLIVEATGSPGGLASALNAVRPGGSIVLKSTYKGSAWLDLSRIVVDEIRLIGSRCGPFQPALRLLEKGTIDPRDLVETTLPLDRALDGIKEASRPGVMKILLKP